MLSCFDMGFLVSISFFLNECSGLDQVYILKKRWEEGGTKARPATRQAASSLPHS